MYVYKFEKIGYYKITPIFALGIPYGIIMLLVSLIDTFTIYKSYRMSFLVPFYSCIYILIFALVGGLVRKIQLPSRFKQENIKKINERIGKVNFKYGAIYFYVTILLVAYVLIYYLNNFGLRLPELSQVKLVFSKGINGHILNVVTALMIINFVSILNMSDCKMKKITYLFPVFWIPFLMIFASKNSLLIYVFALIFEYSYIRYSKINLKKVGIISIIASSLFICVYIARFLLQGYSFENIPYKYIFNHYTFYLTGSFYAYSKVLELSLNGNSGFGLVFAPIINLIRLITGRDLISTIANFVTVDIGNEYNSTNVFTLFGALQYETSILGTILLIILISFVVYYNFYKMIKYRNLARVSLSSYLSATLVFSFFNCFYGTVSVWEIISCLLFISFVEKIEINPKSIYLFTRNDY